MEVFTWIGAHWLDLLQSVGIVSGFVFTAHTIHKDSEARKIANLGEMVRHHHAIWKQLYERPELSRIIDRGAGLDTNPLTHEERLFVNSLLLHLDSVHRAMKAKMFVKLEGLEKDIQAFLSLPIPNAVWKLSKPYQDEDFVRFVEAALSAE